MKKRFRLTKEEIEEGKQEFSYINDCYKELLKLHFDIENYKNVYDNTNGTLEKLVFFDMSFRCFYQIRDNEQGTQPEITCFYRTDSDKLPQLTNIKYFKKGFKYHYVYKNEKFVSKMVYFTTFAEFTKTFSTVINTLSEKFLPNNCYC